IYQRSLTSGEIAAIFSSGPAGMCRPGESSNSPSCLYAANGLVAWWTGDGNAEDIVGGHNGTLENGVAFAEGKVEKAFALDGVDDYVNVPYNPILDPGTNSFTIQAWVRTTVTAGRQTIVEKYECAG